MPAWPSADARCRRQLDASTHPDAEVHTQSAKCHSLGKSLEHRFRPGHDLEGCKTFQDSEDPEDCKDSGDFQDFEDCEEPEDSEDFEDFEDLHPGLKIFRIFKIFKSSAFRAGP